MPKLSCVKSNCEVEKHDMAVTNPRRSQPRPQSHSHRDQKCNYRKPRSRTLLFHGLSTTRDPWMM